MSDRPFDRQRLEANLRSVQNTISAAAQRAGRSTDSVTLLAVTKTVEPAVIQALYDLGVRDFGENRMQVALPKIEALAFGSEVRWHFIGHLQRRKVKSILPVFHIVHSVDSLRLAEEMSKVASTLNRSIQTFLEIKTSSEDTKGGLAQEEAAEILPQFTSFPHLELVGLMTMAPWFEDAEETRPYFRKLRNVQTRLQSDSPSALNELSMGMSNDYAVAIEEGATIVRVGSALFDGIYLESREENQ